MRDEDKGLIVLVFFMVLVIIGVFAYKADDEGTFKKDSTIVETRREHLVFHAEGCRVFQVIIKTPNYRDVIYVAVPHPDKHGRLTTPYPRCQVTAH